MYYLYDTEFNNLTSLSSYTEITWVERYYDCGDFTMTTKASTEYVIDTPIGLLVNKLVDTIKVDYYIYSEDSETLMIIEMIEIKSDPNNGDDLIISGRSLESLLARRIIWSPTTLTGSLHDGIKKLITENLISPTNANRKIPNFIFEDSTDPDLLALTVDATYTDENLMDSVRLLCESNGVGFFTRFDYDTKQFIFHLYYGKNRSHDQDINPWIVFSPKNGNLSEANYIKSLLGFSNVTLVTSSENDAGEVTYKEVGNGSGITRREMSVSGSDVDIDDPNFDTLLIEKGTEALTEVSITEAFDGNAQIYKTYLYGTDYFMGDIVQIADAYGHTAKTRVIELITSINPSEVRTYPSFLAIEEEV